MTRRRFASTIAGAAGLIAVTTLLARIAGFARTLVFADAVRARGVGEIYQSVNALPNVLFEVAAGGILAAVVIPLIAFRLGAGERERAERGAPEERIRSRGMKDEAQRAVSEDGRDHDTDGGVAGRPARR